MHGQDCTQPTNEVLIIPYKIASDISFGSVMHRLLNFPYKTASTVNSPEAITQTIDHDFSWSNTEDSKYFPRSPEQAQKNTQAYRQCIKQTSQTQNTATTHMRNDIIRSMKMKCVELGPWLNYYDRFFYTIDDLNELDPQLEASRLEDAFKDPKYGEGVNPMATDWLYYTAVPVNGNTFYSYITRQPIPKNERNCWTAVPDNDKSWKKVEELSNIDTTKLIRTCRFVTEFEVKKPDPTGTGAAAHNQILYKFITYDEADDATVRVTHAYLPKVYYKDDSERTKNLYTWSDEVVSVASTSEKPDFLAQVTTVWGINKEMVSMQFPLYKDHTRLYTSGGVAQSDKKRIPWQLFLNKGKSKYMVSYRDHHGVGYGPYKLGDPKTTYGGTNSLVTKSKIRASGGDWQKGGWNNIFYYSDNGELGKLKLNSDGKKYEYIEGFGTLREGCMDTVSNNEAGACLELPRTGDWILITPGQGADYESLKLGEKDCKLTNRILKTYEGEFRIGRPAASIINVDSWTYIDQTKTTVMMKTTKVFLFRRFWSIIRQLEGTVCQMMTFPRLVCTRVETGILSKR
jgi:hypothetical protein